MKKLSCDLLWFIVLMSPAWWLIFIVIDIYRCAGGYHDH